MKVFEQKHFVNGVLATTRVRPAQDELWEIKQTWIENNEIEAESIFVPLETLREIVAVLERS